MPSASDQPVSSRRGFFWTSAERPEDANDWLATAARHEGSWWPWWTEWLGKAGSGQTVAAREPNDAIEPAPGRYVMMP